jgi:TRAP-type mannitol/chloroaromatic compound transport system substrate-binding protein
MKNDHGVTLHSWSDDDLALLEEKWIEVATEEANDNPDFKRIWDHYIAYRAEQTEWRSRGYLK